MSEINLEAAVKRGDTESIEACILADPSQVYFRARGGITLLHVAAIYHRAEVVESLVRLGCDLEARNDGGLTPLLMACSQGVPSVVEVMVDNGANLHARLSSGQTALHLSADTAVFVPEIETEKPIRTCQQLVTLLLERGIDINRVDDDNRSALWVAVQRGHEKQDFSLVELMLEEGADPNLVDASGDTILHFQAEEAPDMRLFEVMLEFGAVPNMTDARGKTVLERLRPYGSRYGCSMASDQREYKSIQRLLKNWKKQS